MTNFKYYTDGAATMIHKNGKYLREAGGWAFVLLIDNHENSVCYGGCPLTTNNEMELYAIYASMRDFLLKSESLDMIEIYSDSSYCIDIFTRWAVNWQRNNWKKRDGKVIKNLKLIKAIWKLMGDIKKKSCILKFIKVKGHSSNQWNNKADELAVTAKNNAFKSGKTVYYNENDGLLGGKSKYVD